MTLKLSLIIALGSLLTGCQDNEVKPAPTTISSEAITLPKAGADQTPGSKAPAKLEENTPAPTSFWKNTDSYPLEPARLPVTSLLTDKATPLISLEP